MWFVCKKLLSGDVAYSLNSNSRSTSLLRIAIDLSLPHLRWHAVSCPFASSAVCDHLSSSSILPHPEYFVFRCCQTVVHIGWTQLKTPNCVVPSSTDLSITCIFIVTSCAISDYHYQRLDL
jgi:hypothetical protein